MKYTKHIPSKLSAIMLLVIICAELVVADSIIPNSLGAPSGTGQYTTAEIQTLDGNFAVDGTV